MTENLNEPPRFPPRPIGFLMPERKSAFPVPESYLEPGMTIREYYAAHCPMTMAEAYLIWAGNRESPIRGQEGYRDGVMSFGLRDGKERIAFFEWWALMRFEYADAMIKEGKVT